MKKIFHVVFSLSNFVITNIAFMLFLNWYDTGQLDFGGWRGMAIGGTVFGVAFILLITWMSQYHDIQMNNVLFFFTMHALINGVGLICSFAFGSFIELLLTVKDVSAMVAIIPMILIIPLMAVFYSIMMIPFAIYLGITNGLLYRIVYGT